MALVKCTECGNDVSTKAGACPRCGAPQADTTATPPLAAQNVAPTGPVTAAKKPSPVPGCLILIALVCGGIAAVRSCYGPTPPPSPPPRAERQPTSAPARASLNSQEQPECRINMTGSSKDVPVFPTEEGLKDYIDAYIRGGEEAAAMAFRANRGFMVPTRTRCYRVDPGVLRTKVRILEGEQSGATGWLPTEFTTL